MYVVAIPSYNRVKEIQTKTLKTLHNANILAEKIYIFVANEEEEKLYREALPDYKIIIGELGIVNQRNFISKYFPVNQYIVSIDDDVEGVYFLNSKQKLQLIPDLDVIFHDAYTKLKITDLFLWGIYPVTNPFYMQNTVTTQLKFIIGVLHGYINRKHKNLILSAETEGKEDYQQTLLFYKMDGAVLRYNNICAKQKFHAQGGLGNNRFLQSEKSAKYLEKTYPNFVKTFQRKTKNKKTNGLTEIKLYNAKYKER